ncbi:hypothetical protein [Halogranum rubrum]|uniref:Uncharacterized protein n=1 Tax=Halogranum salarium B-1 TaxID=1210908 RepID=J3JDY7_9EURY|nr:hypothetical protein [Halogranum salarium]EJN57899.1 hypothetical protein HSB1_33160 [Halogranum salarium B-1]
MKQSYFVYMGLFDLALVAGSVARISVGPVSVSWRYFVALTYALFALILPANSLPHILAGTATGEEWMLFLAGTVGGFTLLFYGADIARGGRHFSVETDVERRIELG